MQAAAERARTEAETNVALARFAADRGIADMFSGADQLGALVDDLLPFGAAVTEAEGKIELLGLLAELSADQLEKLGTSTERVAAAQAAGERRRIEAEADRVLAGFGEGRAAADFFGGLGADTPEAEEQAGIFSGELVDDIFDALGNAARHRDWGILAAEILSDIVQALVERSRSNEETAGAAAEGLRQAVPRLFGGSGASQGGGTVVVQQENTITTDATPGAIRSELVNSGELVGRSVLGYLQQARAL